MSRWRTIVSMAVLLSWGTAPAWENRQYFMLGGAAVQSALLSTIIIQAIRKKPKTPKKNPPTEESAKPHSFKDMSGHEE